VCNGSEKFLVRVDARTATLIRDRTRFSPLQLPCDRVRHIFHIGRLQSRQAAAEHRIDWKPAEELEDSSEKGVIRSEHHRRADEKCIGVRRPNRQFAFAALSDVQGLRGNISADSRNVDEPFDAGSVRLSGYPLGRLDVHEVKRLLSVLDVKTDRIYRPVSAGERIGD
jgi:hypothetical protein